MQACEKAGIGLYWCNDDARFEGNTGMNVNLVLFKKNGSTKAFVLPNTVTIVGRQQHCDLCIPLSVVSRKHCEIDVDGEVLRVRDLGSRNGVLVNGKKVTEAVLKAGDKLQIGPVCFGVQIEGEPAEFAAEKASPKTASHFDDTAFPGKGDLPDTDETATVEPEDDDEKDDFFDDLLDGLEDGGTAS